MDNEEKIIKTDFNTDLDILSELLDLHYSGKINIGNFYKVGDIIPNIPLRYGELDEVVDLVVIGVEHDNMIGEDKKAALTLSQVNCLSNYMQIDYNSNRTEYSESAMKKWIDNVYYNALPDKLRELIVPVIKYTNEARKRKIDRPVSKIMVSNEKCFLPSCYEMFGEGYLINFIRADGDQYEYYKSQSNRIKRLGNDITRVSGGCPWTRSSFFNTDGKACFIRVYFNGTINFNHPHFKNGVCPAFCV